MLLASQKNLEVVQLLRNCATNAQKKELKFVGKFRPHGTEKPYKTFAKLGSNV